MARILWLALVVACAAPPRPSAPIAGTTTAPDEARPTPLARPPIAGHLRVEFAADAADLTAKAAGVLDAIALRLRAEPGLNLQVSGHADPAEVDANNTGDAGISHARATAVRDYLIARGIGSDRLLLRAAGASEPRGGGAVNRRVEFEEVSVHLNASGGRVVITDTDVEILDPVTFEPDKDVLAPTSFPALDAVAATLLGNPGILLVEVQSHTDERGETAVKQRLTDARAHTVVAYLVGKGVEPARLVAQGYGSTQPIDAHHTEAAWAKNRRIAFLILKRAP